MGVTETTVERTSLEGDYKHNSSRPRKVIETMGWRTELIPTDNGVN